MTLIVMSFNTSNQAYEAIQPAGADTHGGPESPSWEWPHSPSDEAHRVRLDAALAEPPSPSIRLSEQRTLAPPRSNAGKSANNGVPISAAQKTKGARGGLKGGQQRGKKTVNAKSTVLNRILMAQSSLNDSTLDSTTDSASYIEIGSNDTANHKSAKFRKAEAVNDLLTICTRLFLDPTDRHHWRCNLCKEKHDTGAPQYRNLRYDFGGNTSTMRAHIARQRDHFDRYREACSQAGIAMNKRAIHDDYYSDNAEDEEYVLSIPLK